MTKVSSWNFHITILLSINYFWCWNSWRHIMHSDYVCPLKWPWFIRGNAWNARCSNRENINSTGISRLKILNVLASSIKCHYQKIYFGHLAFKKLGVFLELIKTNCLLQRTTYEMRELLTFTYHCLFYFVVNGYTTSPRCTGKN